MSGLSLNEWLAILAAAAAVLTPICAFFKWYISRVQAQVTTMAKDLAKANTEAQTRCHEDNVALVARVQHLEERSHQETRRDQQVLLDIARTNSEAFKMLAVRMPTGETTPAGGNRRTG